MLTLFMVIMVIILISIYSAHKDINNMGLLEVALLVLFISIVLFMSLDMINRELQSRVEEAVIFERSEHLKYMQEREQRVHYETEAIKMTTLSTITTGVIHEISQPLNAIKVLADGMLYWQETGRELELQELLTTLLNISNQANRINDIINNMRKLANAVVEEDYYPCNVNEVISEVLMVLKEQLASHNIEVELQLAASLPRVRGQIQRLEEIFIHLLINAINALDELEQGEKTIRCDTIQDEEMIIVEIVNNGPNISPEVGQHIWNPFFSTRKGGEGIGLGLSIVQAIVSKLGGNISYNNGRGVTFRLELPIWREKE